jgi:hypothetical protein
MELGLGQDAAAGPNVRLRDDILCYQAGGAWHLEAIGSGLIPFARRATPQTRRRARMRCGVRAFAFAFAVM